MYLFVRLFVCMFALSSILLTNHLTHSLKIRIDYSITFFKERTERFSVRIEKSKYTRPFFGYVTEGGAKMLISCFRNNDTGAFRK